jgi:hypothetical protein
LIAKSHLFLYLILVRNQTSILFYFLILKYNRLKIVVNPMVISVTVYCHSLHLGFSPLFIHLMLCFDAGKWPDKLWCLCFYTRNIHSHPGCFFSTERQRYVIWCFACRVPV